MNDWLNVFFHGNSCVTHSIIFLKESFALWERDKDSHLGWASDQFYSFFLSRTRVSNETQQFSTNHKLLRHQSFYSALHQSRELHGNCPYKMQVFLVLQAQINFAFLKHKASQQNPVPFLSHIWVLRNLPARDASKDGEEIASLGSMVWSKAGRWHLCLVVYAKENRRSSFQCRIWPWPW